MSKQTETSTPRRTFKQYLLLTTYGFSMGTANVIPGVSGGSMALIHGIYKELVEAISSFNWPFVRAFFTLRWKEAFRIIHLRFLIPLGIGVILAVVSLAKIIPYLLIHHRPPICAFFLGLILASTMVIARQVDRWSFASVTVGLLSLAGSYVFVGLLPVTTPNTWWFLFLCGVVAIMAMLLPGISGSFMLLVLGKYEYIFKAVEDLAYHGRMAAIVPLGIFGLGCAIGLVALARILTFLLKRFKDPTMAALGGLMLGSLRKLWPWRDVVRWTQIKEKRIPLEEANRLPSSFDSEVILVLILLVAGAVLVMVLDRLASRSEGGGGTGGGASS